MKLTIRIGVGIIAVNLAIDTALILTSAVHGINDQDPNMIVAMIAYYINYPGVAVLESLNISQDGVSGALSITIAGFIQWSIICGLILGVTKLFEGHREYSNLAH